MVAKEKSTEQFHRAADAEALTNVQVEQEVDAAEAFEATQTALSIALEELRRTQAIWTELAPSLDRNPASDCQSVTVMTQEESPNGLRGELTSGLADADETGAVGPDEADVIKSGLAITVREEPADPEAMSTIETLRQKNCQG